MRYLTLVVSLLSLFAELAASASAEPGDTLRLVRARGASRCGMSEGVPGFSVRAISLAQLIVAAIYVFAIGQFR